MDDSKNNAEDLTTGELVSITPAALQELKRVATEEGVGLCIRIAMHGGGCNGFTVDMSYTNHPSDEDHDECFTLDDIEFIVDHKSAIFLKGASLDFGGGLLQRGFKWAFPKSTGGCGCGVSFTF